MKNIELDYNEFYMDLSDGDRVVITVLNAEGNFKASQQLDKNDFERAQQLAYEFEYDIGELPFDKHWND